MRDPEQSTIEVASDGRPAEKLTDWVQEPTLYDLKKDLEAATPFHDAHVNRVRKWNDLRSIRNYQPKKARANRSQVSPKLIRTQNEWRYAAVSEPFQEKDNLFDVKPATWEDVKGAQQNSLVLEQQFRRDIDRTRLIDEMAHVAVDEGSIIFRTGWERTYRTVKRTEPVFEISPVRSNEDLQMLLEAMELRTADPNGFANLPEALIASVEETEAAGTPMIAQQVGEEEVEVQEFQNNRPTVEIIDPENFYWDPSCGNDITKARFAIYTFETSKADLLKDGRYKNLDNVNWHSASIMSEPDHSSQTPTEFNMDDTLRKRVVAYEYWGWHDIDGSEELKPILATWIGNVLIRMEENPFPDEEPPFVVEPYMPVKRQLMGEPDAELLEDSQAILGALMRGMIDILARSANGQVGRAKGFLDPINERRFNNGENYEFNPNFPSPDHALFMHKFPELPTSALQMYEMQNNQAESLSGIKSFGGGLSSNAFGDVAAGIKGILDAAALREMAITRRMANALRRVGEKIVAMNVEFLSEEEVVRITNEEFVTVRRDELGGKFDMKVNISTTERDQAQAADLGFMLQTMGPNMDPNIVRKILAKIARLKKMPDLAKDIESYQPQPDPLDEQKKMLEIRELEAKVRKLEAEAAAKMAEAGLKTSEADRKDLDFVQEESGVNHERKLQAQQAQAQANQNLEITKAFTKPRKPDEQAPDLASAMAHAALTDN